MAFIPAVNTLRVSLEFTVQGHVVVNVFYLRKASPIITVDLANVAAALKSWWNTYSKPSQSIALRFDQVRLRDMTVEAGEQLISPVVPPNFGTLGADPSPNSLALVTSFVTGLTGRSYRGRVYDAGLDEGIHANNDVTVLFAGQRNTAWANMESFVTALGFEHVVASFESGGAPRATAVLTPVTAYVTNIRLDTQRRRLPPL